MCWQNTYGVKSVPLYSLGDYEVPCQLPSMITQQCRCCECCIPFSWSMWQWSGFTVIAVRIGIVTQFYSNPWSVSSTCYHNIWSLTCLYSFYFWSVFPFLKLPIFVVISSNYWFFTMECPKAVVWWYVVSYIST